MLSTTHQRIAPKAIWAALQNSSSRTVTSNAAASSTAASPSQQLLSMILPLNGHSVVQQQQDHSSSGTTLSQQLQHSSGDASLWASQARSAGWSQAGQYQGAAAPAMQQPLWLSGGLQHAAQRSAVLQQQTHTWQQQVQLLQHHHHQQQPCVQQAQELTASYLQPLLTQLLPWPGLQLPSGSDDSAGPEPLLCIKRTYQPHVRRYKRKHGFLKRLVVVGGTLSHLRDHGGHVAGFFS